nr:MAG TPA: hypothetical protein [Bacteriophage sp.]
MISSLSPTGNNLIFLQIVILSFPIICKSPFIFL